MREGWEKRLADLITARAFRPFVWGENDCLLFAFDATDALHDTTFAALHRGKYRTEREAHRRLAKAGGFAEGLAGLGFAEVPPKLAQRGDVAVLEGVQALGIIMGAQVFAAGPDGLTALPRADMKRAFTCRR
jgi:hypothetical protein